MGITGCWNRKEMNDTFAKSLRGGGGGGLAFPYPLRKGGGAGMVSSGNRDGKFSTV